MRRDFFRQDFSREAERRNKLAADRLRDRQLWRDRRLTALAAHKRKAAREVVS